MELVSLFAPLPAGSLELVTLEDGAETVTLVNSMNTYMQTRMEQRSNAGNKKKRKGRLFFIHKGSKPVV